MLLRTNHGRWCQESWETETKEARRRAAQLRRLGYRVTCFSMGPQRTDHGVVKLTMVDVRPGSNEDTLSIPTEIARPK